MWTPNGFNLGPQSVYRSDIAAAYPPYGGNHGFSATVPAGAGSHNVCAYAINTVGAGGNASLGCKTVSVTVDPIGVFDSVSRAPGGVRVQGWALDPDTASAVDVHVYVDSVGTNIGAANVYRSDVAAGYPSYGGYHGFAATVPASAGTHNICAYGINYANTPGSPVLLGCKTFTVTVNPFGVVDSVTRGTGTVRVVGWAIDPDTASAISVRITVGALPPITVTANGARSDVGSGYPSYGPNHGFDSTLPISIGTQTVCVTAINTASGVDTSLGCRNV